jgi:solute carrier family 25 iron transporter 28/37
MQSLVPDPNAKYRNLVDALYRIARYEGIRRTVRGLSAVVLGAGPAHALFYACYEKTKATLNAVAPASLHHIIPGMNQLSQLLCCFTINFKS